MSARVLLNLLNKLRKRSLFFNKFNKFNNTKAQMLDSIQITLKSNFCRKNYIILSLCMQRCFGHHNVP